MQLNLDIHQELLIVNFAGGGGSCTGIEMALGRRVDVAINHDPEAIAMHKANHPETKHYCESVWDVNPRDVTQGRPVGLVWLSPDCKHFSKAKGGKPVEKKIRGLAWVTLRWAALKARVIMLENVEEFVTWGPLVEGPDGNMRPCPKRKGREFNVFVNALRRQGYEVEWRVLRACDYGTPTIRRRLFLIARCDGQPIVWPEPTHADPKTAKAKKLTPWRTAAECIDWSIPCPSIFERAKPLADATLRRIAKGIMRYVVNAADPFIVKYYGQKDAGEFRGHSLNEPIHTQSTENRFALVAPVVTNTANSKTTGRGPNAWGPDEPLRTITSASGFAVVAPVLTEHANASSPRCMPVDEPLRTICAQTKGGHHALVSAFLAKHYTGVVGDDLRNPVPTVTSVDHNSLVTAQIVGCGGRAGQSRPRDAGEPLQTITAKGDSCIATSSLVKLRNNCVGQDHREPLHTITGGAEHFAEVRAFLIAYYGVDQDPRMSDPMHTVTANDRFGLVTVAGQEYQIADIGLRMLAPRELYRAQGFPDSYIIGDNPAQGLTLTKTAQVRMVGNSVCPPVAAALVGKNLENMAIRRAA